MKGRPTILERLALDRPEARAWALYDWANSAFWTTVIATVFPTYYQKVAAELGKEAATQAFANATVVALACVAVMAPVLGALADRWPIKKRLLAGFVGVGAAATGALFLVHPGDWMLGLILFGVANIGASGSVVFYDALLPHVARKGELDRLSASGFALGYLGGGALLTFNLAMILNPSWFGLPSGDALSEPESTLPVRLSFLSVAVWWLLFTIPLLLRVPEPAVDPPATTEGARGPLTAALGNLRAAWGTLRAHPQALLMLLAFLVYNDGILTIIRMAALIAKNKELADTVVIGTILAIQFVGIPFAFLFGGLAARLGAKRMIFAGLVAYCGITVLAYFMTTAVEFVLLGVLVGMVQGGTQALSRSLFASLIPANKSGELFGLFAVGEKFAGILGPAFYALAIALTGSDDRAILTVLFFFVCGGGLLLRVDVEAGRKQVADAG